MTGTDTSARSLERARVEARRLGAELTLARADFRDLSAVGGPFDVVVCADNALPHMASDDDLRRALSSMFGGLARGGVLVVSTRDYDTALRDRGFLILTERDAATRWAVAEHVVRYRAVTAGELARIAGEAGLTEIAWHSAPAAGFHQPVMTAVRRSDGRP